MTSPAPGWIGDEAAILHYLDIIDADRDTDGRFLIRGEVVSFMGTSSEVVVSPTTVYFVAGRARNLASALASTSAGCAVTVM